MNQKKGLFPKKVLNYGMLILFLVSSSVVFSNENVNSTALDLQQVVTGTIISQSDGIPLVGATVLEKGTSNGVLTDFDGNYSIEVGANAVLRISFLGYQEQEIVVGDQSTINVSLAEDLSELNEVVVVGYGTQRRQNVTGSLEMLEVEDVVRTPASNVANLLIGQVPGLITNQNPGLPGSDNVNLSIRGFGNPLVIVDGVESFFGRLDPNDIESISFLKDASAAIYGARAGNGVILVTTKRGKEGKTTVNYHGWQGVQNEITFADFADASEYIRLGRAAIFNDQYNPENPDGEVVYPADFSDERLQLYESGQEQSYDWSDGLLKTAFISQHNISARGGSEKIKFYTSLGTLNQDGIFSGDYDYSKLTITNNLDAQLTDDLSLSFNSSWIDEFRDYASTSLNDFFTDLRTAQPFYPMRLPDRDRAPFSGLLQRSPTARVTQAISGYNRTKTETLAAALQLEYNMPFLEGLTLGARVNVRFRNDYQEILRKPYDLWTYEPDSPAADGDGYVLQASNNSQQLYQQFYYSGDGAPRRRILSRLYSKFERSFGKHNFDVLVLGEKEDNKFNNLFAERRELLSYDVPQISGQDDLTSIGSASTGRTQEYVRVSYAGRVNYNFDNKYLLEATMRADGSSYFGPDVRWGYFPSISVGWNLSNERFLENSDVVRNLKLRLSYSETGIDSNVGRTTFDYLTGYSEATGAVYFLNGVATPIIQNQGLVNPFITWEETILYNAGLDFSLMQGKFFGTVEAFYRERAGLLRRPIESFPSTFGAQLPLTNLDQRSNRGFDLSLGYLGSIGDFKIKLTGNMVISREKFDVVEENIDEDDPFDVKFNKLEGRYVGATNFGFVTDGLLLSQDEVDDYVSQFTFEDINGVPQLGDLRYKDLNGDGIINLEDRAQLGYGAFPEMTFALNTNFEYKGFALNLLWQGATRFNVNIANQARNPFDNERVPLKIHSQYSFYQDPDNPGVNANPNAELPAFGRSGARAWNNVFSDYWYRDATYLRLKTANLSYNLPQSFIAPTGFNQFELYVSADNLLMFNKLGIFDGIIDPEEAANNDGFTLPTLRTVTFGVRLGL